MARPLIIDCDPGVDDAIALLLALASPTELDLLGITTVAGNVPLPLTQANARRICTLAQATVPVYAGCPRPLLRPLTTAEAVHGSSGLADGVALPEPTVALQTQHGVDFLIETLMTAPEPVTLAMLGPLTNLAVALVKQPQILAHLQEVVIMGGAITYGNVTPAAEFNFYTDPHAAKVVFESGAKLTLFTLDVTHQTLTTPARLAALRALGPVGQTAAALLDFYGKCDRSRFGLDGAPLHDPCVIAYLLDPDLFTYRQVNVTLDAESPLNLGRSLVDWWGVSSAPANTQVAGTVNADGFYTLLTQRLSRF